MADLNQLISFLDALVARTPGVKTPLSKYLATRKSKGLRETRSCSSKQTGSQSQNTLNWSARGQHTKKQQGLPKPSAGLSPQVTETVLAPRSRGTAILSQMGAAETSRKTELAEREGVEKEEKR